MCTESAHDNISVVFPSCNVLLLSFSIINQMLGRYSIMGNTGEMLQIWQFGNSLAGMFNVPPNAYLCWHIAMYIHPYMADSLL